jgi:phage/plasmid-like protein (TIGR03299 family)
MEFGVEAVGAARAQDAPAAGAATRTVRPVQGAAGTGDAALDVNRVFAEEKARQIGGARRREEEFQGRIERGEVRPVGDDRYEVLTGWDRGEVFTVSRDVRGRIDAVIANHGLDVRAGSTLALYASSPAWHGLGQIIPGGTTDIDTVLDAGGLGFTVATVPALYRWGGELREHPEQFHTVREDTGAPLGAVGRRYRPIQNRQGFEFLQELVGRFDVVWESAGVIRGGRRVFVSIRLPQSVTVDADGINDRIVPYIAVMNDHCGNGQFQCVVTPWRPVCANTERFAVRDAVTRWAIRHTAGATSQIKEARRTLGLSVKYFERFADEETALARTDIAVADFHRVVAGLWPLDDDASKRTRTNHATRLSALEEVFRTETEKVGRTAYAAERAVTGYLDHIAPRRPGRTMTEEIARAAAALEGTDDDTKTKAHRQLLQLTRA